MRAIFTIFEYVRKTSWKLRLQVKLFQSKVLRRLSTSSEFSLSAAKRVFFCEQGKIWMVGHLVYELLILMNRTKEFWTLKFNSLRLGIYFRHPSCTLIWFFLPGQQSINNHGCTFSKPCFCYCWIVAMTWKSKYKCTTKFVHAF